MKTHLKCVYEQVFGLWLRVKEITSGQYNNCTNHELFFDHVLVLVFHLQRKTHAHLQHCSERSAGLYGTSIKRKSSN